MEFTREEVEALMLRYSAPWLELDRMSDSYREERETYHRGRIHEMVEEYLTQRRFVRLS